jgi:hypothetical protein
MGKRTWVPLLAAAGLAAAPALAAPQSTGQRRCLAGLAQRTAALVKAQDRSALRCLTDAARGRSDRLGGPGQTLTAQACVTNDRTGSVAKGAEKLAGRESRHCLAKPEQLPGFGYAPAADVAATAAGESVALVADLFGADLGLPLATRALAPAGARCQEKLLASTQDLLERLLGLARSAEGEILKGRKRVLGADPKARAGSRAELETELVVRLEDDTRERRAKQAARVGAAATKHCAATEAGLAELFPGCAAADPAGLVACAERAASVRFWRILAAEGAFAIPCDLSDDAAANRSCAEPALLEHVLARTGYGGNAFSRARIAELGAQGYLLEQLEPGSIEEDASLEALLAAFPSLAMSFRELRDGYPQNAGPGLPGRSDVPVELQRAELLRRIVSRRQLQEVLVDLWFNHFNVNGGEGSVRWDATPYARDAIRPHVLGRFGDLVLATARAPAMSDYLDNRVNVVGGINENYSRELLELHTLSVAGPYTETDVKEVARILTGWGIDVDEPDGFRFRADRHDFAAKTVLGVAFPAGVGYEEGVALIELLATHPNTASFVATKLARRFVSESPPPDLVARGAEAFLASGGDLRATLEALLLSDEFLLHTWNRGSKTRRPSQLWVSLARTLGADPAALNTNQLRRAVRDMGEALFQAPPPTGWPDVSGAWSSPGGLVQRLNALEDAAEGELGFVFDLGVEAAVSDGELVDGLAAALFPAGVSKATRDGAVAYLSSLPANGDTVRLQEALAFLLASPEFLTH